MKNVLHVVWMTMPPSPINIQTLLKIVDKWIDTRPVILVVDDATENRRLIQNYLEKENAYRLIFAQNGQEATDIFSRRTISLILMDMEMPILDGYRAAAAIRKLPNGYDVAIIAITAHLGIDEKNKCIEAGCSDYLAKPIRKLTLLEKVHQSLSSREVFSYHNLSATESVTDFLSNATLQDTADRDVLVCIDPDLEDLIPLFLKKRREDIAQITKHLENLGPRSMEEICKLGHSMKGSGGSYGFDKISRIGEAIENAARKNDDKEIKKLNNALSRYISMVKISKHKE